MFFFVSACLKKSSVREREEDVMLFALRVCSVTGRKAGGERPFTVLSSFLVVSVKRSSCYAFLTVPETLSLRIQLDYSGQIIRRNQNISAFSQREQCTIQKTLARSYWTEAWCWTCSSCFIRIASYATTTESRVAVNLLLIRSWSSFSFLLLSDESPFKEKGQHFCFYSSFFHFP